MAGEGKYIKFGDDKRQISIIPENQVNLYNIANGELLTDEFGNPLVTEVDTFYSLDASKKRATSIVFNDKNSKYTRNTYEKIGILTATYGNLNNILQFSNLVIGIAVSDKITGRGIPDATSISRISGPSGGITTCFLTNNVLLSGTQNEKVIITRSVEQLRKSNVTLKIAEQFKDTSEVSTTLLGVNRAEVQLALFSNVSSYGLDSDDFEFYSYTFGTSYTSWENRKNKIYGNRYTSTLVEETQESSIKITAFPTPYSYPFGPKFKKFGLYNKLLYNQYKNFITFGNQLNNYFAGPDGSSYSSEWKSQFLSPSFAKVIGENVVYPKDLNSAFSQIDTWTETWKDIKGNKLIDPVTGRIFGDTEIRLLLNTSIEKLDEMRPGYSSANQRYGYLQSRRVFRYQPGRISGFTFGLRSSVDPVTGVTLEWGISNPTDEYIFQIDAGQFYIIRRSTIPLEKSALERSGLKLTDQTKITSGNPLNDTAYWTIKIPRDKFNGDPLNSNGKSGYLLQPENVTMYKIEFGWYGAIGARFYAYIPTDNGGARWVVIHTLVIENSLEQPCLQDSYFRFKYSLSIPDTFDIRKPQYLYKYGASYYIDGGDEGTSQIYSVSSKQKTISSSKVKSLLGVIPKNFISNRDGKLIQNKKLIIPTEVNISTDSLTEVKVVTCTACPGFGHVYTPGIAKTESGRYLDIQFTDANTITTVGLSSFTANDVGAKIIAPSIYNAYITSVIGNDVAKIKGFGGTYGSLVDRNIASLENEVYDRVAGIITTIPVGSQYPYPIRLSNYDAYAASDFAFTGSKIEIQFLNPNVNDNYAHFADFLIGITDRKPVVSLPDILNGFTVGSATTTILPNSKILYGEHTHIYAGADENGVEVAESWPTSMPPVRMGIDYRIPSPPGTASGICSKVTINVKNSQSITDLNQSSVNPVTSAADGLYYIIKQGSFEDIDYDGGQIAILNSNGTITETTATFVGVTSAYTSGGNQFSYIRISESLSVGSNFKISIRPINISATGSINSTKLYNYNPFPLYLVAKLRDYAQINNISVKETIGDFERTISPKWYIRGNSVSISNADGNADTLGSAPTNFKEVSRLSSALIDTQNDQSLRPYTVRDTLYVGANSTESIDMKKIFGPEKRVITPDNNNLEATFITAQKIDGGGNGTAEITISFKEQ